VSGKKAKLLRRWIRLHQRGGRGTDAREAGQKMLHGGSHRDRAAAAQAMEDGRLLPVTPSGRKA
jgi:transposase-like protein